MKAEVAPEALEQAWQTLLVNKPGTIVAQSSTGTIMKVLCAAEFGMLAWRMDVDVLDDGNRMFLMKPDRQFIGWHHIWDLNDWRVVPCQPMLMRAGVGPMGWVRTGEPLTILLNLCLEGVHITVKQMKKLLLHLGIHFEQNKRKDYYQKLLITSCVEDPDLQQQCLDKIPERDVEGEEGFFGSDMEEVLSALGEDDANFAEIKKYKQGLQNKRKKKMRSDQQVPGRGRGKGKGKGKRKGRGKGKGKGKGRGRQGTFAERQMLKRRRDRRFTRHKH